MLKNNFRELIQLIKSGITDTKFVLSDDFETENLYSIAKKHQIMGIIFYGALCAGLDTNLPVMQKLYIGAITELTIHEKQIRELSKICDAFSKNGISYMPLKGSSLKKLYQKPETRLMTDIDILIKLNEYPRIAKIMNDLGYTEKYESNHEFAWSLPNGLTVELHKMLIPSYNSDYFEYFGNGWEKAILSYTPFCYTLKPEDEFIYIFTHFAKHYRGGGMGIRQFCDLWIYLNNYSLDNEYIEQEFSALGLLKFYKNVRNTLAFWFEAGPSSKITDFISHTIVANGSFGTDETKKSSSVVRSAQGARLDGIRTKLILCKIKLFPSKEFIISKYPYLADKPWLLPLAWVSRWFSALRYDRKKIIKGLNDISNADYKKAADFKRGLHYVGLDFNFKEHKR